MDERQEHTKKRDIIQGYQAMESLPQQLLGVLHSYSQKVQKEHQRHNKKISEIEQEFTNKKNAIASQKKNAYAEASAAQQTILAQLQELQKSAKIANEQYAKALNTLPKSKGSATPAIGTGLSQVLQLIQKKKVSSMDAFDTAYTRITEQEKRIYAEKTQNADRIHDTQLANATELYNKNLKIANQANQENKNTIVKFIKQSIESLNIEYLRNVYEMLQTNIPSAMNFASPQKMPIAIEMGYLSFDFEECKQIPYVEPLLESMREHLAFALRNVNGKTTLQLPYGRVLEDANFNKLIIYDEKSRIQALEYIRALEMRLFMSIPCGKLRVTMVDPVDSGSNFSMFSCLGDDDERIISTKIWSDSERIKDQLKLLIGQIEHVHQDCLRDEYENIIVYNEFVGKNAEPLQVLFIADFPRHFDQEAYEMLEKIVSSGPKCGIYTFIVGAEQDIENSKLDLSGIVQVMEKMVYKNGILKYMFGKVTHTVNPIVLPEKQERADIFEVLKNGIKTSDRIIIKFDEVSENLTQHPERWFQFSDENGLDIPIGLEGALRTVQLHLGGELITQHHALISGTIGAGKSTLLHTIIMSILLRYSPEDVQIYLLDFKRGVEFKIYADSKLPNFRVISLETEPEFGLSVLRHLEEEQALRAQEFHDKDCDNIERYNELIEKNTDEDTYKLSRIVLIIDEFHEMFSDRESKVSKECEMLLEQIIRQGRALGIHVILASQTLPDNIAPIYGQIMNRIALQSTATSAQYILDSDNEAINTLIDVDAGKGIFNDGGGNRDANHPFRVAYFEDNEQRELLEKIRIRQNQSLHYFAAEKPRLLLSTIQDDNENPLNQFVKTGVLPSRLEFGCPLYLGEEIAMVNEFSVRLTSRKAQNVLILGSDYKRANLLYGFSAMSILFNAYRQSGKNQLPKEPIITYFDFGKNTSQISRLSKNNIDIMNELSARFPYAIRVFGKDSLLDGIDILQKECNAGLQTRHYVIFAGLNRARRLLDNDSAYRMSPKQMFSNLVKHGPEAGYNFIIWANEPSSFCDFYADLIPEFDYRLVYNLTEEEYKQVIKSSTMNTDYGNNNIISYNPDEDNKKVRIYSMPLQSWFMQFMNRLEGTDDEIWETGEFEDDF
ncbi:MAG: DNA translocase FtsK [Lachnospiraceae bacterium]|nr:DNA translocase FtsK [Lachnospiraceae bacterium]